MATPHSTAPHTPGAEADPNSSSSTLVNHGLVPSPGHDYSPSPMSPFADPNALAQHNGGGLYPITEVRPRPRPPPGVGAGEDGALWAHRLSESFGALADQIAATSRALAVPVAVPVSPSSASVSASVAVGAGAGVVGVEGGTEGVGSRGREGTGASEAEVSALATRLDAIERAQEKLGADLQQVQAQLARLQVDGSASSGSGAGTAKQKEQTEGAIVEVAQSPTNGNGGGEGAGEFKSATEMAVEELQRKVDGVIDTIKLEQARLYARLHNATVTSNKMAIKAPTMANGKAPQNFPNTKGEFEHLTKERYEHILKSYDVAPKGDTKAKREQLREFIGLTPAAN